MAVQLEKPGRSVQAELIATLRSWEPVGGYGGQMHAGDVGWYLRFDDDTVAAGLHVWRTDDGSIVAAGLQHGPQVLLTTVDPLRLRDVALGEAMAADALESLTGRDLYVDAPFPAAVRVELARRGWDLDPDPWPAFYRPLTQTHLHHIDDAITTVDSDADVHDRVAVQQAMFQDSQSTVDGWRRMRQTDAYSPTLDLIVRESRTPVAAATAWSAGPQRCGLLEPVGVHRDHRGRGHGARAVRAALAALARAGASGAAVFTSGDNTAALALYRSCGFRTIGLVASMRSPAQPH